MTDHDLTGAQWHKSTRSSGSGDCVEAATNLPALVAVRDTKNRNGGTLIFTSASWSAFIAGIKADEFSRL